MLKEYFAVLLFFFIVNKFINDIGMLILSTIGFSLALIMYTKAVVYRVLEMKKAGEIDEDGNLSK